MSNFYTNFIVQYDVLVLAVSILLCYLLLLPGIALPDHDVRDLGAGRLVWLLLAAACVGFGIWAAYLIGMLVFDLGVKLEYQPLATLISFCIAVSIRRLASSRIYQAGFPLLLCKDKGEFADDLVHRSSRIVGHPANDDVGVSTLEGVSERKSAEAQIAHMAGHDGLTGLPNRANFLTILEQRLAAATSPTRLAVLAIDLDRFKDVNDQLDHAAGDSVLRELAARVRGMMIEGESVSRFGGDEFAACKLYEQEADLQAFVERIREAVRAPFRIYNREVSIDASIGIATYPRDAETVEKLIGHSDTAMYRAKCNLTQRVCYYQAVIDTAARDRRLLARDLQEAIGLGQLSLAYQVQKSICSGATVGYEALLRWRHPIRGMVPPSEFIPVAEEFGSIFAIGEWVLRTACVDAMRFPGIHRVAVNLSPVQISHADIAALVSEVLTATGLAPERLELEVTEGAIISDRQKALNNLNKIRTLGVKIALDDFGIGYSSLETLRTFQFDKIKLDRSFLQTVDTDMQSKAIVRAILALGNSLQIPVLAEGLERADQLAFLAAEGCNEAQGYFLGRPQSLESLQSEEGNARQAL